MDINKIKIFLEVVKFKNITKTSEALGYTQSGITHIINGLEKEVGFRLLKRSHNGVSLTTEGLALMECFQRLVDVGQQIESQILSIKGLNRGSLSIGSFTSVTLRYLPDILREFVIMHPNIDISLMKGNCADMEKCLDEGTLDIAFLSKQDYHQYDFIELLDDPIYAIMSPENKLAAYNPLPIEKLNNISALRYCPPTGCDIDVEKIWAQVKPKNVYTTNFDYSLISMARQGLGVCLLPGLMAEYDNSGVAIRLLEPFCSRKVGMAVPKLSLASPVTRSFIECALSVVGRIYQTQPHYSD